MEVPTEQKIYFYTVYDHQGHKYKLDELEYLNYLIEESNVRIKIFNKSSIRSLIWDFHELREYPFFRKYLLIIDNQISSLRRIAECELIHQNRPRRAVNHYLLNLKFKQNTTRQSAQKLVSEHILENTTR